MKIFYDYQIFSGQIYGGISRYFVELASHLKREDGFYPSIIAPLYINRYLEPHSKFPVKGRLIRPIPKTSRLRNLFNQSATQLYFDMKRPDIVHETYYHSKRLSPPQSKTVITVYDMIHEKFEPSTSAGKNQTKIKALAIHRADHVICISESTKKDLVDILKFDPKKVTVIHLANSLRPSLGGVQDPIVKNPYLLYVGQRGGYKNFSRLLKAYSASSFLIKEFVLVCFGGGPFTEDEKNQMSEMKLSPNKVVQLSGSDDTLVQLYSGAQAFIYPSLYEGFGLPLLEAMSLNCPVICSDSSSFPEVAQGAAQYFDPTSVESMVSAIESVVQSEHRRQELIQAGSLREKDFSWLECARLTQAVYANLVK